MEKGYWNGEPAEFRVVVIVVGDEPDHQKEHFAKHRPDQKRYLWFVPFIGTERQAVEVTYGDSKFYLDNADGNGIRKVTKGMGSPTHGHKSIYPERILHEVPKEHWQLFHPGLSEIIQEEIDEAWMQIDPDGYTQHKKDVQSLLDSIKNMKARG